MEETMVKEVSVKPKEKKKRGKAIFVSTGYAFVAIFCNLAISIGCIIIFSVIIGVKIGIKGENIKYLLSQTQLLDQIMELVFKYMYHITILYMLVSAIIFYIGFKIIKKPLISRLNIKKVHFVYIILSIPIGISISLALANLLDLISRRLYLPGYDMAKSISAISENTYVIGIVAIVVVAPLFEEFLFRGLILNQLKKHLSIFLAVVIQGILFGIYHLNITQGFYATILGIVFGIVVVWLDSIWASIAMHMSVNLISVLGNVLSGEQVGPTPISTSLVFILGGLSVCVLLLKMVHYLKLKKKFL